MASNNGLKGAKIVWLINGVLILGSGLLIGIKRDWLPEKAPLFYSLPWGEGQLANKDFLFLLPGLSLAVGVINWGIGNLFLKKGDIFLFLTLQFSSLLLTALLTTTLFKIVFLIS